MPGASFWTDIFSENDNFASSATVPWLARAFSVHIEAAVHAFGRSRARLPALAKFTRKPWVAEAFFVET